MQELLLLPHDTVIIFLACTPGELQLLHFGDAGAHIFRLCLFSCLRPRSNRSCHRPKLFLCFLAGAAPSAPSVITGAWPSPAATTTTPLLYFYLLRLRRYGLCKSGLVADLADPLLLHLSDLVVFIVDGAGTSPSALHLVCRSTISVGAAKGVKHRDRY